MLESQKVILMNGHRTTIGDAVYHMACSPLFGYSFIHTMLKDELGRLYHQFDIYKNPPNITNYYNKPLGNIKFTITGALNDLTKGYYDIYLNGQPLSSDDPMAGYCASAMVKMDNVTTEHLHALDDLTFKLAGQYVIKGPDDNFGVFYNNKLEFYISNDDSGIWYLDRPNLTPVHPYHMLVSKQCVTNLLNRRQER